MKGLSSYFFPMLVKPEYAAFAHMLGRLAQRVTPEQLTAIERLS